MLFLCFIVSGQFVLDRVNLEYFSSSYIFRLLPSFPLCVTGLLTQYVLLIALVVSTFISEHIDLLECGSTVDFPRFFCYGNPLANIYFADSPDNPK